MPPSGHSSSSHSSRSSGSSRSFGGSSSHGGFSSGPSRHSSSSHFSTPGGGSPFARMGGSTFGSFMRNNGPRFNDPPPHFNRPSYFSRPERDFRFPAPPRETYRYSDRIFYGHRHQYRFYPLPFIINGISYGAGYYDEDGTYYKNLEMQDEKGNTVRYLTCEYCGCQAEYKPEDGVIPNCAHCGAPLKIDNVQKDSAYSASGSADSSTQNSGSQNSSKSNKWIRRIIIVVISLYVISCLWDFFAPDPDFGSFEYSGRGNGSAYSQSVSRYDGETIYLKKSGRSYEISDRGDYDKILSWDSSADSYYDGESKCWLWYNTDVTPALWQYWFEGISSEYGDYGWMECKDGTWYIEVNSGKWKQYTGSTYGLWYIDD